MKQRLRVLLVGKPNSGKSSLFNRLTGLRQKVGNFPGVTVDKKTGLCRLQGDLEAEIVDLPGAYSLYPRSPDERIVANVLLDKNNDSFSRSALVVADASNLQGSLLILSQLIDLRFTVTLALNMMDEASELGIHIDTEALSKLLGVPVAPISARLGEGIDGLKKMLCTTALPSSKSCYAMADEAAAVEDIQQRLHLSSPYEAFQYLQQGAHLGFLSASARQDIAATAARHQFNAPAAQSRETLARYRLIQELLDKTVTRRQTAPPPQRKIVRLIDGALTHKVWGYLIFLFILTLIFQSIFTLAQGPMDFIDASFASLSQWVEDRLPDNVFFRLLSQGLFPGLGGIVMFVPQIAILFMFISILEETGYMSRVVFLMDNVMRKFGMNGKSVVPLISGWACAIPAMMATRTIENRKDRIVTLFVAPLMSCSARLPVYAILIAIVAQPYPSSVGLFNLQGLMLTGFYLLGLLTALLTAVVLKKLIPDEGKNLLVAELPPYRAPRWSQVLLFIIEKVKTFVWNAGRVILVISIALWLLASYGPGKLSLQQQATQAVRTELASGLIQANEVHARMAFHRLKNSYAGHMGRFIEPAIAPLGYDWKIGIALISSFAAREVFVSVMATLYGVEGEEDSAPLMERLQRERNASTGQLQFNPATVLSLLVFYTFAMQCMSTLAVARRETKGWTWPLLQLLYMTALAYVSAWGVYQLFS